jgi:hypothetical protein
MNKCAALIGAARFDREADAAQTYRDRHTGEDPPPGG